MYVDNLDGIKHAFIRPLEDFSVKRFLADLPSDCGRFKRKA